MNEQLLRLKVPTCFFVPISAQAFIRPYFALSRINFAGIVWSIHLTILISTCTTRSISISQISLCISFRPLWSKVVFIQLCLTLYIYTIWFRGKPETCAPDIEIALLTTSFFLFSCPTKRRNHQRRKRFTQWRNCHQSWNWRRFRWVWWGPWDYTQSGKIKTSSIRS